MYILDILNYVALSLLSLCNVAMIVGSLILSRAIRKILKNIEEIKKQQR